MSEHPLFFNALRGFTHGREVFSVHMPIEFAVTRLAIEPEELSEPLRVGRLRDESRESAWAAALCARVASAPSPSVIVAVDQPVEFRGIGKRPDVGTLKIAQTATWIVQSGRNFLRALRAHLRSRPGRRNNDTISVTLYVERDPARIQAGFRLLQQHGPVSRTRRILGTETDLIAQIARSLATKESPFAGVTEMHKSTLAPRAKNLFTLSAIYLATRALLNGRKLDDTGEALSFARDFWYRVAVQFPEWEGVRAGQVASGEMRANFLHAHAVILHAIGRVGARLVKERPRSWKRGLEALRDINWKRSNAHDWEGRALLAGKVANTTANVLLVTAFLKSRLHLRLTAEEEHREAMLRKPFL